MEIISSTPREIDTAAWLQRILENRSQSNNAQLIRQAVSLAQLTGEDRATPTGVSCLAQGLAMGEILNNLNVDSLTIVAAVLDNCVRYADLSVEDIAEHFGQKVVSLIQGTQKMDGIRELSKIVPDSEHRQHNIDNIRKMLLAMVDDIRVVLINLAERLCILRSAAILNEKKKRQIAQETMAIYAPLTHRLGIAQIKWEMEDLSFRYLEPEKYQEILNSLEQKFPEREQYLSEVIKAIQELLIKAGISTFKVTGRTKHVYSVYRKMMRKKVGLEGIFDVCAVRIFVPEVADCYTALSSVHEKWQYIPEEFDDYIASPKANGYRSIHTAIIGPKQRTVEIQVRTYDMHNHAELGVAAHWVYKEGKHQDANYEAKISWLRQVMDWQQEVVKSEDQASDIHSLFSDQVYVFTPEGDILDFPQGSTPLDFAYHIHSDVGHRCCGAKVDGKMVPLTYPLKMGERVEIITSKNGSPSRDWLNPSLGFLKTTRARAKVFHWFRKQSQEQNLELGQELLEREMKRLSLPKIDLAALARKLNYKTSSDMLVALGSGLLKLGNILNVISEGLEQQEKEIVAEIPIIEAKAAKLVRATKDVQIQGVDNLLTHMANCCKPVPGDSIVGYITQGQGIAIHREDCVNALYARKVHPERLIVVSWGSETTNRYPVDLDITAFDRRDLIRDITNVLAEESIKMLGLEFSTNKKEHTAHINLTIEIEGLKPLSRVLAKISQIPNITEVRRTH